MLQVKEASATQAQDGSGATLLPDMPARVEPNADDVPLGAVNVLADRVDPWSGDNVGSLHHGLVVHGAGPGTPGHTTPGDVVPAHRFLGAVGPGVAGLLLLNSPGSPSPPLNWGLVEDSVDLSCSQDAATKKAAVRDAGSSRQEYPTSNLG
jgi:hypothetical protein